MQKRIAFVQYGEFAETYRRLAAGGSETYYAQRASVEYVSGLAAAGAFVGICSFHRGAALEETLAERLESASLPHDAAGAVDERAVIAVLERWQPTNLVMRTPLKGVMRWALSNKVKLLPTLADSWPKHDLKTLVKTFGLRALLNSPAVTIVANHNIPACLSLARIGVDPRKIVPWDWPHALVPEAHAPKALTPGPARLLYVGAVAEAKGALDCIRAADLLKKRGFAFELTLIGGGPGEAAAADLVADLGLGAVVRLAGKRPHEDVIAEMTAASLVLVPSRHDYPEGLPMTLYEAMATRTPLIVSDHPMFVSHFAQSPAARMVAAADPASLADAIEAICRDQESYRTASAATAQTWRSMVCPLTWQGLIDAWLADETDASGAIRRHAIAGRPELRGRR